LRSRILDRRFLPGNIGRKRRGSEYRDGVAGADPPPFGDTHHGESRCDLRPKFGVGGFDGAIGRWSVRVGAASDERDQKYRAAECAIHAVVADYQPRTSAKISGATMLASLSTMNFGVSTASFPQVIFSLGTAPEYEP
jgi:hypothetical protein